MESIRKDLGELFFFDLRKSINFSYFIFSYVAKGRLIEQVIRPNFLNTYLCHQAL